MHSTRYTDFTISDNVLHAACITIRQKWSNIYADGMHSRNLQDISEELLTTFNYQVVF